MIHIILVEAIYAIMNGHEYFGKDISEIIYRIYLSKQHAAKTSSVFTPQENKIIRLCCQGLLVKEIAERLDISSGTVKTHKTNIFHKLGINNSVELAKYVMSLEYR